MAKNLIANLLGQDMLGQMDTVVTMDHWAFYKDMLNEGEKAHRHGWGLKGVKEKNFFQQLQG